MSRRSRPLIITAILLAVLVASSLIILISGIAMASYGQASKVVAVVAIICGGSLTAWHLKALISGAGRTHPIITASQWISLTVVGIFALVAGFGIFDLLGGRVTATRIVLSIAGVSGLAAAIIETVRNAESDTGADHIEETTQNAEAEESTPQIEDLDTQAAESDVEMTMIVSVPEARARRATQDMDDLTWLYDSVPEASETKPKRARRAL
uniref:hypothetical protein n=1 Tax=Vaginimicrobium propionicum TaxID=1871034 RepID=UPI0009704D39|nr:hypothetical protein [Vaginimicrobium propionicum]